MSAPRLILVNIISAHCLTRYQMPFAVNALANYVHNKLPKADIKVLDMQAIYSRRCAQGFSSAAAFESTCTEVVDQIHRFGLRSRQVVGLSMKWDSRETAVRLISLVQNRLDKRSPLFVLGNIGATFAYRELLLESSLAGALAVVGEGEDALTEIVRRASLHPTEYAEVRQYLGIPNVALVADGVIQEPPRSVVDLAQYPRVETAWATPYPEGDSPGTEIYELESSRGCPHGSCTFCSVASQFVRTVEQGKLRPSGWRPFPLASVLDQIQRLAGERGARRFNLLDSEFFGPVAPDRATDEDPFEETTQRAEGFARGILDIDRQLGLSDGEEIRIEHISLRADAIYREDEDERNDRRRRALALLKQAGVQGVYLGVESGSPAQLRRYNKGVTVEENVRALAVLRDLGFSVEVGFIFFDHRATIEDLRQNLGFIHRTNLGDTDSRLLGSLKVLEGSPLSRNKQLALTKDLNLLSYEVAFNHEEVGDTEFLFRMWEDATREFVKCLPKAHRIATRRLDLQFVEEVLDAVVEGRSISQLVEVHSTKRRAWFSVLKDTGVITDEPSKEALIVAEAANDRLRGTVDNWLAGARG